MWGRIASVFGGIVIFFLVVGANKCNVDPCKLVTCQPGFHCEKGKCIQNPPPEDPCLGITCPTGQHCESGKCVQNPPPPDPCMNVSCQPGFHCDEGNCVPDNPPACEDEKNLVVNENQNLSQLYRSALKAATTKLGDPTGQAPADTLSKLANELRSSTGVCWIAGQEAVFGFRPIDKLYEEYHAVYFGNGSWTDNGYGKFIGFHRLVSNPPPPNTTTCPAPLPPHVYTFRMKVYNANCANTDTTLLVYDKTYCTSVGYYDQNPCPVRLDSDPNRAACEAYAAGGYFTWKCEGGCQVYPCNVDDNCACAGKVNHNPAEAIVMGHGTSHICDAAGVVCGSLVW